MYLRDIVEKGRKLLICVIHLPPLPGSPEYCSNFEYIIDFALRSSKNAEEGGADGVIIENFNDKPFLKVPPFETLVSISIIVREVAKTLSIPVGVNILRNACTEAAIIASLTGAKFIRCNAYCEPIICPEGIIEPEAGRVLRALRSLNTRVEVLADLRVKHAVSLYSQNIEDLVEEYYDRCRADFIIITGSRTGKPPSVEFLDNIVKISKIPILVGSGININNVKHYRSAHGYIVGTYVKDSRGMIDIEKVKALRREIDLLR